MKITFYGHASLHLSNDTHQIILDPFISPNPEAAAVDVRSLKADAVLLSHGHADHVADARQIAEQNQAPIIANFEVANWFQGQGYDNIVPVNHGGEVAVGDFRAKYTPAIHSSSMPDGSYGGEPGGFVIREGGQSIYFAADTALDMNMKLIGELEQIDLAILPIGGHFTMGYEDAIVAADFVQCDKVLGIHYNTFPPIVIDTQQAQVAFAEAGKELILLSIGESLTV